MSGSTDVLSGRRALVTGASSGLGRHFARLLSAHGAAVAVAARREDRLRSLTAELEAEGGTALSVTMDVCDEASVAAGFDAAERRLGPIDTVIVNAGISLEGSALDLPAAAFDEIVAVNLRGTFLTAREGARRMIAAGGRDNRIVLVASIGGLDPLPGVAAYSASKAGVVMLGRSLAREWANRGINVNVLCPGFVRTELNADWFETAGGQKQIAGFPRRRLMGTDGLDAMLVLLAGPGSAAMTGSILKVDDGQSL